MAYDFSPQAQNAKIVIVLFAFLATVSVVLRMVSKRLANLPVVLEDWLIFAALFFDYGCVAIHLAAVLAGGVEQHATEVKPSDMVILLKLILPLEIVYAVALLFVKFSIMSFYIRIFGTKNSFRISVYIVMFLVMAWCVSLILETLFLCRPLAYNWDQTIDGTCGNRNTTFVSAGVLNMITDILIMLLPIPHIWKLQLQMANNISLVAIFSLGIFATAVSIVRLKSLMDIDFTDVTYSTPIAFLWSLLEMKLAVINANLPLLRPVVSRVFPKFISKSFRSKNSRATNSYALNQFDRVGDEYPLTQTTMVSGGGDYKKGKDVKVNETGKEVVGSSHSNISDENYQNANGITLWNMFGAGDETNEHSSSHYLGEIIPLLGFHQRIFPNEVYSHQSIFVAKVNASSGSYKKYPISV
ncbi:MAG: hypothetical protein M1834_007811 [Cirrosporium novae-zelandiae]|nr:MAG: hypothetical protein M1834_007811 [Cirrosporium novae-zelandiae]